MITFTIRRSLQALLILIGLTVFFFAILRASPGGPCAHILATPSPSAQGQYDACVRARGLNDPLPVQYVRWVNLALHGDFGVDYTGLPVFDTIKLRLPATILLMGISYILQQLIALPLGMIGALKRYTLLDQVLTLFAYFSLSLPTFWLGLMLILFFSVRFGVFPPGGITNPQTLIPPFGTGQYWSYFAQHPAQSIGDFAWHLILPALTLAIIGIGADSRFMRGSMLDVINQDYVRTAKAKGLTPVKVVLKHTLRNALLPIVTNVGLYLPALVSGAIITESIFGWPGMGQYFANALGNHDNNALQTVLLFTALFTLLGNLLADIMYGVVDPRIRYD
jgi:peptide/nickel transport system permease protein